MLQGTRKQSGDLCEQVRLPFCEREKEGRGIETGAERERERGKRQKGEMGIEREGRGGGREIKGGK